MRVLVLGAGGQLGQELARGLPNLGHEVTALDRGRLDITDPGAVEAAVSSDRFQRVVNCAAYTKVDLAESQAEAAFAVNRDGARLVALACARRGIPLCHVSTDFVFGQEPTDPPRPWSEADVPEPHGVYAESKREGELACLEAGGSLILVRTSWLYGGVGPNFPLAILRAASEGERLRVVADQVGSPTWTRDLFEALGELIAGEELGLFHLSGSGSTTWYHFAETAIDEAGLSARPEPVTTADWGAPAPRPRYSVLDNGRWRELGKRGLPAWQESLRRYLASERRGALAGLLLPGLGG